MASQLRRTSAMCRLDMREAVTVARSFGFRDVGNDGRGLVCPQRAMVVEVALMAGLVGVDVTVVVGVFVDWSTIRLAGRRDGHG